jgi:hypothetical protein
MKLKKFNTTKMSVGSYVDSNWYSVFGKGHGSGEATCKGSGNGIGICGGRLNRIIQVYEIKSIQQPTSPRRLG